MLGPVEVHRGERGVVVGGPRQTAFGRERLPTGVVTFLLTDVEGSTRMWETDADAMAAFNKNRIDEFRANGGKVGGPFEGGDLLLLTTTGARSGTEHTVPLGYVRAGGLLVVVGSAGGGPRHPAWYHNLLAHPMVRVEVGAETFGAVAVPAEGARRDRLFEQVVRVAPGFAGYQAQVRGLLDEVSVPVD